MIYKYLGFNFKRFRSISSGRFISTMNKENVKEFQISVPYGVLAGKIWNEGRPNTPIIACHGWMDNCGTFDKLCPLLQNDHPIIAVDFPGHGLSSSFKAGAGFYFTDNLITIERIIQHFEFKKVILMGHSMGGGASMLYAGTIPECVEKLIAIDIIKPIHIDPEDQPKRTASSLKSLLKEELKTASSAPSYSYEDIVDKVVNSYRGSVTTESAKILLKRGSTRNVDGSYSFSHSPLLKVVGILSMDFAQQQAFASNISCDYLLLKYSSSPKFSTKEHCRSILETYEKSSKNFQFTVLEGMHHQHLNEPEPSASVINKFLKGESQNDEHEIASQDYLKAHI